MRKTLQWRKLANNGRKVPVCLRETGGSRESSPQTINHIPSHHMNVTITHNRAAIDPFGTISEAAWPEFLARFEGSITASISREFPDADVRFVIAEPCGNGVDIDGGDPSGDIAWEISEIINRTWEIAFA